MATKLAKPLVREVEIKGEAYLATLMVKDSEPLVTLRKKGTRGVPPQYLLRDLLEDSSEEKATDSDHDKILYKDIMTRLNGLQYEKAEPLREIVRDIFEINILVSDLSDEEVVKRGVSLLD